MLDWESRVTEARGHWELRRNINLGGDIVMHDPGWWRRRDGAEVFESDDEFYANPNLPGHRRWKATVNGEHLNFRFKGRRHLVPRRWKTPEAAMASVDREFPMEE